MNKSDFSTEHKLDCLNKAYKENNRLKKNLYGYKYGKTDCFNLFTLYDNKLRAGKSTLHGKIKVYNTHKIFHAKVKRLGYADVKDFVLSNGYKEVSFEEAKVGDTVFFDSIVVDITVAIYDGVTWISSSDDPKYERLPNRFIEPRVRFVVRPEKNYEKL
jgi:hypothetical protein